MSMIELELYVCYHCKAESLKTTVYSSTQFGHLMYRTDGKCTNHATYSDSEMVMWCTYCEKFVIGNRLKRGSEKPKENNRNSMQLFHTAMELNKKYFSSSKIVTEAWKKDNEENKNNPSKNKCFSGIRSCKDILIALKSLELKDEEDTLYKLRLYYWRKKNEENFSYDENQKDTTEIYENLMSVWEECADERYLFKAEMLRNTGKFKESNNLLKNPFPEFESVLLKYKNWAKVIKTMNGLKYKKAIEITI